MPAIYYANYPYTIVSTIVSALATNACLVAYGATVSERHPAWPAAPDFPEDYLKSKEPGVLVSYAGKAADETIAFGEYGVPVRVAIQIVMQSPFQHSDSRDEGQSTSAGGKNDMGDMVTAIERALRDQNGIAYNDQDVSPSVSFQVLVRLEETTPITLFGSDPTWMQQTITAVFTAIGD